MSVPQLQWFSPLYTNHGRKLSKISPWRTLVTSRLYSRRLGTPNRPRARPSAPTRCRDWRRSRWTEPTALGARDDDIRDLRDPNTNRAENGPNNRRVIATWLTGTVWTPRKDFQRVVRRGENNPSRANYAGEAIVTCLLREVVQIRRIWHLAGCGKGRTESRTLYIQIGKQMLLSAASGTSVPEATAPPEHTRSESKVQRVE